jgi:hypothetical protein
MDRAEETSIVLSGDWTTPETSRLQTAWFKALAIEQKLSEHVRYMHGMSGKKYRYLINNLIESTPDARYLEVGSWRGSTACSAMYGNKCKVTCIDNWAEFGGPRDEFFQNIEQAKNTDVDFTAIEQDFRTVDYNNIGKYNIYMFDGPHLEEDQYDGVKIAQPALDDTYTLIVDDWSGKHIQVGTKNALRDLGHEIVAQMEIITRHDDAHPKVAHENSDWHCGYFIAVVKKPQ